MDTYQLKDQVGIIRETFGYINRFKGSTFVFTLDSTLLNHPLFPLLIKDLVLLHKMGIRIVVVPGARLRINEVLKTYGIRCRTVEGVRITTARAIPFIKMAAFDVCNRIMTMLSEHSANAVIGNWVRARAIGVRDGIDYRNSGVVEKLKSDIVKSVIDEGLVPIFPTIGWSAAGKPYNISAAELAFTVGSELQVRKLFFVTSTDGIRAKGRTVPDDVYVSSSGIISQLRLQQAGSFLEANRKKKYDSELELVSLAHKACLSGVERVHIVNGGVEGMILKEIFSNRGLGTMVYASEHEHIRPMTHPDIPEIIRLMRPSVEDESLVPREFGHFEQHLADYYVYEVDGTIHGCGALHVHSGRMGEIAGLVVDRLYANMGVGGKLIAFLVDKAKGLKLHKVFVLTTRAADRFMQEGFAEAGPTVLPESKKKVYDKARNSRVLVRVLRTRTGSRRVAVE